MNARVAYKGATFSREYLYKDKSERLYMTQHEKTSKRTRLEECR